MLGLRAFEQGSGRDALVDTVLMVVGGIAGLVVGALAGFWLGGLIKGRKPWAYWTLNIIALVAGVAGALAGLNAGSKLTAVAVLGLEGGILTGLKYGYGHNPGVQAVHERLTGTDKDMPR